MWMAFPSVSGRAASRSFFNLLDDLEVRDAVALGRGERFFAGILLLLPGRGEKPHAAHALDRLEHVDRAAHGPPAVARGLHEAEAAQRPRAVDGRRVGDQPAG